jgi:MFS family permease
MSVTTAEAAAPGAPSASLGRVVLGAWPLLASILLLMTGSGLQGSLLGVRAELADFEASVTGFVLGLYYLGYVAGSAWAPGLIRSVGHIRVFSALASMASAAVIIHGVWVSPLPWVVLRFLTGVCVAGLFVVSESWLNDVATSRTRGSLLAIYNTVVTLGLAVGSLLLNTASATGVILFVVGSVLLSMAAVPVALAPHDAPVPEATVPTSFGEVFRAAPLGPVGSTVSGFGVGAALGFGAVYASRAGFGVSGAAQFVAAVLIGAVIGQIPLGNWSDRTDRRIVMGAASGLVVAGGLVGLSATVAGSFPWAIVAALLVGAGAFSLYGLSFAHLADYIDPMTMIAAGARLMTLNGLGAAAGPFLASVVISRVGPSAYFELLAFTGASFCIFVIVRMLTRPAPADERRAHYVSVAAGATFAVLDDVVSENVGVEPDRLRRRRIPRPRIRRRS